ncbi:MAG TPA: sigma-E factor regulatory protein RseB domain-containing protein [Streptosporangiaceae bacterium]|nr:sigma-E factor regulatory protein RseB domain-containing protein [Streptosporangiaceae bacterium]
MDTRSRPAVGTTCPGSDPAALRVITVAVLAGLVVSGIVVISRHGTASLSGASAAMEQSAPSGLTRPPQHGASSVRLLSQAAKACQTISYQGEEMLSDWGQAGPATSVMEVWHASGGVTMAHPVQAAPGWSGEVPHIVAPASYLSGQALIGSVMLGMSQRLAALLSANYQVAAVGWGRVAGRRARVITARRDGRLAARIWLDKATTLPLRRETFDEHGHVVSVASFMALTLGNGAAEALAGTVPRQWVTARLARLRAEGWPLPGPLPDGLALLSAREGNTATGPVVDLDYSDGLSLVSVFLQRGHLKYRPPGWWRMTLGGSPVYADDSEGQMFVWPAQGFVYTLVAAAPPQTVAQVAAALPHNGSPGLLARLGHGLHRLVTWLIP